MRYVAALICLAACGDDSEMGESDKSQTPPMGAAAVQQWLSQGDYKGWNCEPDVHEARSPSPHGFNRICSNDLIANNATAAKTGRRAPLR